jgi:cell division protein FtsB
MFQLNRMGIWFIFLFLSFFLFFIIWGDQGYLELYDLQSKYRQLHNYSQTLEQENVNLHQLIERLKHDPKYVERIARTELGMIRENEKIIKFSRRKQ